jgi:hypothetical protein
MSDDLVPRDMLQKTLRLWWLPLIVMLIGGAAGFGFHLGHPPLYESDVTFTFSFDLARLGEMTTAEEDQAMGVAGAVLFNTGIYNQLLAQAQSQHWLPPGFDIGTNLSIERQSYRWVLRARLPDAQNARLLAQRWSELGKAALDADAQHALQAYLLERSLDGLESCLSRMSVTGPATSQCSWPNQPEVQNEAAAITLKANVETIASQGMIVGLNYNLSDTAQVPSQPVSDGRNTLILIGGLLGFFVGFLLIASGLLDRRWIKAGHAG